MSREDSRDILIIAFWLVVFYELGYFVGRYHERLIYHLVAIYSNKKEDKSNESNSGSTE